MHLAPIRFMIYQEEARGFSGSILYVVMAILGFAAGTGENKKAAGCEDLSPDFGVFV